MFKALPKHPKNLSVDMTAMCDVTFLLLCFFVVTARFEQWEPMKINTPKSTTSYNVYKSNIGIIFVADNRAMFEATDENICKVALEQMSEIYNVNFTADETKAFMAAPIIGAPIKQLKKYDGQYMNWESNVKRPGIPCDTTNNELFNWIRESRKADAALNQRALTIMIKADKNVKYATLRKVMNTLRNQKVSHVSLITESDPPTILY